VAWLDFDFIRPWTVFAGLFDLPEYPYVRDPVGWSLPPWGSFGGLVAKGDEAAQKRSLQRNKRTIIAADITN
jgi:hypothetical protein